MEISNEQHDVLIDAVNTFGEPSQLEMAVEEMAELIVEIKKAGRLRHSNMPEEIADVFIMMKQLAIIANRRIVSLTPCIVQPIVDKKIERLNFRIVDHKIGRGQHVTDKQYAAYNKYKEENKPPSFSFNISHLPKETQDELKKMQDVQQPHSAFNLDTGELKSLKDDQAGFDNQNNYQ